ncbi:MULTISPECIES: membrane protein insertase YidC [Oceanobacillus]|uniref:Membrane protein insertase YidC n=1 Tax=Oceanobacillus kimchii TaxID=746691 RepID=A0ABQ5TR63_9BACI|nr:MULTISPECIES: membrane protein insertase YidC [Oceanobacillus]MBT2599898.1 membrane protein insertase YidC [Oceanobacillus sp. ISL-74]MBT2652652.1 membrane protein insertase YidC [Oceanobacillus sp. ISL-73]MCT1577195.1 membrane protein insertase YidC [Oceanobacillus kimchii]MCT2135265.1 membrane protein insertase YidC [Oceanobacillus kimchii]OEH56532.1 OxaA precursor [Oceanobacillus sp. E9]
MRKKFGIIVALIALTMLLSGCTEINEPITPDSDGIWNTIFVYPVSWLITAVAGIFNEGYGLAIIIVTIFVRLLLMPLNVKQIKSSKAMQEIQPKLQEIQKKYTSKDANTQQKLQQETMELFQKNGVNPLAGCLPILVQMPIFVAMYHAIMRTPEISTHSFLWFQLGSPDYILPILTALFTFLQQKMMMSTNSSMNSNPQMKLQMQIMLYVMPIMIGVMAFFFPAALALYWVTGNVFMVFQTLLINKPMMAKK